MKVYVYLLAFQSSKRSRLYTMGWPRRVAQIIADGYAEPAVVGPHYVDARPLRARDAHGCSLASVLCQSFLSAWKNNTLIYKNKTISNIEWSFLTSE